VTITPFDRVIISSVRKDFPMSRSGAQVGDELVSINGKTFQTAEALQDYVQEIRKRTEFKLRRSQKEITLQALPNLESPRLGFTVEYYSKDKKLSPTFLTESGIVQSDQKGNRVIKTIGIYQALNKTTASASMLFHGKALVAVIEIYNDTKDMLEFNPASDVFLSGRTGDLIEQISEAKAQMMMRSSMPKFGQSNSDQILNNFMSLQDEYLSHSPYAALNSKKCSLPAGIHQGLILYYDAGFSQPPYTLKIKTAGDEYNFEFNLQKTPLQLGLEEEKTSQKDTPKTGLDKKEDPNQKSQTTQSDEAANKTSAPTPPAP
jgi:hypothetical protein